MIPVFRVLFSESANVTPEAISTHPDPRESAVGV
jgi:hypothetical protein